MGYYSSGTTPLASDPRLKRWTKMLLKLQKNAGSSAQNNPAHSDTNRMIKVKILKNLNG